MPGMGGVRVGVADAGADAGASIVTPRCYFFTVITHPRFITILKKMERSANSHSLVVGDQPRKIFFKIAQYEATREKTKDPEERALLFVGSQRGVKDVAHLWELDGGTSLSSLVDRPSMPQL
eukprot:gene1248-4457_t